LPDFPPHKSLKICKPSLGTPSGQEIVGFSLTGKAERRKESRFRQNQTAKGTSIAGEREFENKRKPVRPDIIKEKNGPPNRIKLRSITFCCLKTVTPERGLLSPIEQKSLLPILKFTLKPLSLLSPTRTKIRPLEKKSAQST